MNKKVILIELIVALVGTVFAGCETRPPVSDSGIRKASVKVDVGSDGLTTEQRIVGNRIIHDNKPGSIEYLYIFSSVSGQIMYSDVVKGKVTSSGKRLTPRTISGSYQTTGDGFPIKIEEYTYYSQEVLGDDGTYGDSFPYLYYWDTSGIYHQIFVSI